MVHILAWLCIILGLMYSISFSYLIAWVARIFMLVPCKLASFLDGASLHVFTLHFLQIHLTPSNHAYLYKAPRNM